MTEIGIAFLWLIATTIDYRISRRRIIKYGQGVELNPFIRLLSRLFGISKGLFLGSTLPNLVGITLLLVFRFKLLLVWAGMDLGHCFVQLNSLKFESAMDKYVEWSKSKGKETGLL